MNILFCWDGEYPWDIRVEKVCNSLIQAGHTIHLVCRNQYGLPREELYKSINVHRIASLPKLFGRLNGAFTFPAFFSPVWLWRMRQVARREKCALIIVRDLPMSPAALWVGRSCGIPVILDMAECYPEMLRCAWEFEGFRLSNLFVRNPRLADAIEQFVLRRIDHVFVMVEESQARLLAMGIPAESISIVSNTPDQQRYPQAEVRGDDELRLFYVGLLNPSRGVDTMLDAASHLKAARFNVKMEIVGSGKHAQHLRRRADAMHLQQQVHFAGWVENTRVPDMIAVADVGIVPHYACSHWNNTIPNKLFDYMAAAKPVIVSDASPTARIVRETGCGLVYPSRDARALAAVIEQLRDPGLRRTLGQMGRSAIQQRYNWQNDAATLVGVVNRYASG